MISLTRLNQTPFILNAIYIEKVESTPDTIVTLVSGKKVHVIESVEEVTRRVTDYYREINLLASLREPNDME